MPMIKTYFKIIIAIMKSACHQLGFIYLMDTFSRSVVRSLVCKFLILNFQFMTGLINYIPLWRLQLVQSG